VAAMSHRALTKNGPVLTAGQIPCDIAVADFNGDGNLDLAIVNDSSATLTIYLGNGDGTFTAETSSPTVNLDALHIIAGDFNGDGIPDLVVTDLFDSKLYILLGKGDGTFTTSNIAVPANFNPNGIVAADFNGDGKLDLAVTGGNPATAIFLGNGDGTFTMGASLSSSGSVIAADFNGDGKIDLAVANETNLDGGPTTISVFLGNGDGTFTATGSAISIHGDPLTMTINDFNRDGVPDIAVVSYESAGGAFLFLGKGDGTFSSTFGPYICCGIVSPWAYRRRLPMAMEHLTWLSPNGDPAYL
jgi:FG-GAP-like repeat